jgi:hypothetical protein
MTRCIRSVVFATACLALAAVDEAASGEIAGKGLKTGLNSASMAGAGAEPGLTSQIGGAAGVFMTLELTDHVAVQPEILYTQKGAELEAATNPFEYRFSYVEVPLLWKLTLAGRDAAFRPNLYAGPFVGVKVGAQVETYHDRGQEESDEVSLPSARGIDAGIAAGIGADLSLGPGRILVDIRYEKSLVNAMTTGARVRHSVASVLLGYVLN